MLTPSDIRKIENFNELTDNHKAVFKFRTKDKCKKAIKDMNYFLLNYKKLNLKVEQFIDIDSLKNLVETYENIITLQNM